MGQQGPCSFLRENEGGRRWACALMLEHGDWALVHADQRYLDTVRPYWEQRGTVDCGDWPQPGKTCPICGQTG
jgi:hypothetical protein